ncbi:MAG: methylmalonyl Co-A mutase-associated GTPase MeaB [Syntrophobacteria bacterium]
MDNLVQEVLQGSARAMARLITLVENQDPHTFELLSAIYPHTGRTHVVGMTGSQGTGKSTLTDQIATVFRQRRQTLGIIAVDPSSPFSGGALLGDRIRMQRSASDPGIFIRSMATRGHLGGLARATNDVIKIMDAFGKDWIVVETVGVGQDEVDIARSADTTILVLAPGLGDSIQSMKAGVMEIADLYVVNKADRAGADELFREVSVRVEQDSQIRCKDWQPPVLKTVAVENEGTVPLVDAVEGHRRFLQESGTLKSVRREKTKQETLTLLQEEIARVILKKILGNGRFESLVDDIVARKKDPYSSVQDIVQAILPESS